MFEAIKDTCKHELNEIVGDSVDESGINKKLIYEQPLTEQVRAWLRMEYLFCHIEHGISGNLTWDSRMAISGLLDMLEFISRNDLKPDLIKELERYVRGYKRWQKIPGVDEQRLSSLLGRLEHSLDELNASKGQFGRALSEHALLSAVKQRSNMPGGTCRFDLPSYHFWLQKNINQRQKDLKAWLDVLTPLRTAIELSLYLIRNNAMTSAEFAAEGFYQAKLDGQTTFRIIRVAISEDYMCYPEISGGKHRFSVRFFENKNADERPVQTQKDVNFELCCCMV